LFKHGCPDKDLLCLGIGYPLYYYLQRKLFLTFLDLTVFISSICIILVFSADGDGGEYALIVSIKKIFSSSGNAGKADTVMYVNLLGIIYLLLQAILITKNLGGQHFELDSETVTPSDFAVIVRDIPKDITKEVLKNQLIEE
jgi:hypothetical protein